MAKMRPKYGKDAEGRKYLKYYYAEFYDPHRRPKQKRVSLRTTDKTAARQKFTQLEREHMADLWDPWADRLESEGVTMREAVARFVKDRQEHCTASTVETYAYVLGSFVESLAPTFPLYGVERRHIAAFLESRDLADATRRSYADRLRIFFAWCVDGALLKESPAPEQRRSKKSRMKGLPPFFSEEDHNRFLRAVESDAVLKGLPHGNRWLLDVVRFATGTGLRRGELINLRWNAVDLKGRMLTVKNTESFQTKSGRERYVPLVGEALRVACQLQEERVSEADGYVLKSASGEQLYGNYLSKRFREYRRLAGLPKHLHFHSLCHTFASWFVLRGGDLYRLKEIMGHADMKTTLVYAHLRPDALRAEMEQCFGNGYAAARSENALESVNLVERLRVELAEARAALARLGADVQKSPKAGYSPMGIHRG